MKLRTGVFGGLLFVGSTFVGSMFVGSTAAHASAIVDDFTFTAPYLDDQGLPIGSGTVTGEVDFAGPGTGVSATAIYILSEPANTLGGSDTAGTSGTNFVTAGNTYDNTFTVGADGTVSNYNFLAETAGSFLQLSGGGQAGLASYDVTGFEVYGEASTTFTAAAAADVPEPASLALLGLGATAVTFARRRRVSPAV